MYPTSVFAPLYRPDYSQYSGMTTMRTPGTVLTFIIQQRSVSFFFVCLLLGMVAVSDEAGLTNLMIYSSQLSTLRHRLSFYMEIATAW